jgi:hypothetical protein
MAFIAERNSIVFRAGDSPIWNRNETILPMSWRLFKNTIEHAGHEYSLQTIPTLSSALDFDVRRNQPDFTKMLDKRIEQANIAEMAKRAYQNAYSYSDYEIEQLDPDEYADEIMSVINNSLRKSREMDGTQAAEDFEVNFDTNWHGATEVNEEQLQAIAETKQQMEVNSKPIYAGKLLSKEDLVSMTTGVNHEFDKDIIETYTEIRGDMWTDHQHFVVRGGDLYGLNGEPYIVSKRTSDSLNELNKAMKDGEKPVYGEQEISSSELSALNTYDVTDEFYKFLVSLPKWTFARGRFEQEMARRVNR